MSNFCQYEKQNLKISEIENNSIGALIIVNCIFILVKESTIR